MIPVSGSAYTYAYASFGELIAWIVGWDLVLEYAISNVGVAISWGDYARSFLEPSAFNVPAWLAIDRGRRLTLSRRLPCHAHLAAQRAIASKLALFADARHGLIDGAFHVPAWEALAGAPLRLRFFPHP